MEQIITLRIARPEEAQAIHQGMAEVYEQMENKELFVCDDLDWVKAHMEKDGFAVVACDEQGNIAASLLVVYPGMSNDILGRDIGLAEEELVHVAHMETAVVLPQYRGQHLQRRLLQYAEAVLDKKQYWHLLSTISPDNPASYKSIEACGYQVMTTKEKYGGLMRRIYYKNTGTEVLRTEKDKEE